MVKLLIIVFLVSVVALSATMIFSISVPNGNKTLNKSGRFINDVTTISDENDTIPQGSPVNLIFTFLLAGKDKVADNTDTIMLAKLDVTHKSVSILNIPRDTMLDTNRKSKKVNSSYQIGGIELLEQDVASLTGFYVNRYVLFDIEGIAKIIDAIGGVDFDVPQNMNYEDPTQNLSIHLKKGFQHLNGEQAVKLARYRHGYTNGDIGRINAQQELLKALAKQALKPENILILPELVRLINENVETDIDLGDMLWIADQAKDISISDIETDMVPGVATTINNLSYWLPFENELLDIINSRYNPLDSPITSEDLSIVAYPENEGM